MFNHSRGLWGYTGLADDGEPLTVQSTGMGGPSAAIVCEELVALGVRRLVRIGTCGALRKGLELGELVAAELVVPADGASSALGATGALHPDSSLTAGLVDAGAQPVTVLSTDLFYAPSRRADGRGEQEASVVEMEAAAVLQVGALRGVAAACALGVSDVPGPGGATRLEPPALEALGQRLGELGYAALRASVRSR